MQYYEMYGGEIYIIDDEKKSFELEMKKNKKTSIRKK